MPRDRDRRPRKLEKPDWIGFTADEAAKRHGASAAEDTMDPEAVYGPLPPREPTAYRDGWLP